MHKVRISLLPAMLLALAGGTGCEVVDGEANIDDQTYAIDTCDVFDDGSVEFQTSGEDKVHLDPSGVVAVGTGECLRSEWQEVTNCHLLFGCGNRRRVKVCLERDWHRMGGTVAIDISETNERRGEEDLVDVEASWNAASAERETSGFASASRCNVTTRSADG